MSDEESQEILERIEKELGSDAVAEAEKKEDVDALLAEWLGVKIDDLPKKLRDAKKVRKAILERAKEIREEEEIEEYPPIPKKPPKPISPITKAVESIPVIGKPIVAVGRAIRKFFGF